MEYLWDAILRIGIISSSFFTGNNPIPENEVPSVVRNTFKVEFPDAVEVEWEKKVESFEVDFESEETEYSALFDKTGKMLMHKKDIPIEDLPAAVKQTLQKYLKNSKIEDVGRLEKEGVEYFLVEFEGQAQKQVLTADGKPVTKIPYLD